MSRSLAFGDLGAAVWGVAWDAGEAGQIQVAVGTPSQAAVVLATLAREGDQWRLEGEQIALTLSPTAPSIGDGVDDGGQDSTGLDQLCTVSGLLTLGDEHELDGLAWRTSDDAALDTARIDSVRRVAAWFAPDDGLTLLSVRPRKGRGHEDDLVAASVVDPERAAHVADARLSTTYDAAGIPARAGVELWLEQPVSEEPTAEDPPQQFPRRAAGERVSAGADWEQDGLALRAVPLRWHSHGLDGGGVYLLGRRPG